MSKYNDQLNMEKTAMLQKVLSQLPDSVFEFTRGIENKTTVLTRLAYARDLKLFFDFLNIEKFNTPIDFKDLDSITINDIEDYLSYLSFYNGKTNSLSGKKRKLATLRSFYKYHIRKGNLKNNPAAAMEIPKIREKAITYLETHEVANLLDEVENSEIKKSTKKTNPFLLSRDLAIFTLFLSTGIRISELVGLNIEDLNFDSNSFLVTRKGAKEAILFFTDETKSALISYLNERSKLLVDKNERALFLSTQKKRICNRSVQNLVKKHTRAVVPLKNISPHKLRSTFGTMLYNETGDIYLVADVLGHEDVNTTKKHYAHQSEQRRFFASKQIKLREDDDKK